MTPTMEPVAPPEPIAAEQAAEIIRLSTLMLENNRINPKDEPHCRRLVQNTPGVELTQSHLRWLAALINRKGAPFVP